LKDCLDDLFLESIRVLYVYIKFVWFSSQQFATMTARLTHPLIQTTGRPVNFSYDGQTLQAQEGETIAAALVANGIRTLRHTKGGQRRGLYCGMGACQECLVTVDGVGSQRACMTKVQDGQVVSAALPPHVKGEPVTSPPLRPLAPAALSAPSGKQVDVLVVGAGPAGLSAALAARKSGATVTVLDERPQAGGQYYKPLAPSHAAHQPLDKQFADGVRLTEEVLASGVEIHQGAQVWAAFSATELGVLIDGRATVYQCRRLIIAAGAYERPVSFPGWTLPGVMTTGAGQTLARAYRVAPGQRVVIAGNGPLNLQLAVELLNGGATVLAVIESAPRPSMRHWRELLSASRSGADLLLDGARALAVLRRHGVPVHWGYTVTAALGQGDQGVDAVYFARLNAQGQVDPATEQRLAADTLCVGYGFVPSTDIARMLGCEHRFVARHLGYLATVTDENGLSTVPGVWVVGDGADMGGARVAAARGALAGYTVARELGYSDHAPAQIHKQLQRALNFQRALWTIYQAPELDLTQVPDETLLCRCEDITFGEVRAQIAAGRDTLAAIKRNTRLGMGRCQGRYCANVAARLLHEVKGANTAAHQYFAPRAPVRPVPAGALAFEKPEWGGHRPAITPNLARPTDTTPMSPQKTDVLVIGGGVLGANLAYFLAQAGQDVLVVDRDDINLQASGANAGSLHVQLLSFDFGEKAQEGGGPAAATLPLGPLSVGLWQQIQDDCGEDLEVKITGGLMVADSPKGMAFLQAKVALERRYGIEASLVDGADLQRLSPALSPTLLGAEWCPMEGKINPLRATYAVARRSGELGARFLRNCNVERIEQKVGAAAGFTVHTSRGVIHAGRVVNASGAWSSAVGDMLGVKIPVKGAPLQMIVTEPAPPLVSHLIAHADRHLSMKQAATGGLIIGGGWTAAYNPAMRLNHTERSSIEGNLWVANQVLPALSGLHVVRCWAGMNVNIDGAPILGEVPGVPGFFNAVTSNGYTLAPIVAKLATELLVHGHTDMDIRPYSLARFS
jgi:glycine/D-amino acid oxidase-like deaminating enzyme